MDSQNYAIVNYGIGIHEAGSIIISPQGVTLFDPAAVTAFQKKAKQKVATLAARREKVVAEAADSPAGRVVTDLKVRLARLTDQLDVQEDKVEAATSDWQEAVAEERVEDLQQLHVTAQAARERLDQLKRHDEKVRSQLEAAEKVLAEETARWVEAERLKLLKELEDRRTTLLRDIARQMVEAGIDILVDDDAIFSLTNGDWTAHLSEMHRQAESRVFGSRALLPEVEPPPPITLPADVDDSAPASPDKRVVKSWQDLPPGAYLAVGPTNPTVFG